MLSIAIGTVATGDIVSASAAAGGFAISGTASGADGQTVTVTIVDSANSVVDSYTTTAAGGSWSVAVTALQAEALADGGYTVTADVSDAAGNAAPQASRVITVDETAPSLAIGTVANHDIVNASAAAAGFTIGGTESGADGQTVTVRIRNQANAVVDTFTTTAAGGSWSVAVTALQAKALADGGYTVTADVSDAAGNAAPQASRPITVDETAPSVAIGIVATNDTINASAASAGFTITGSETGADGQTVTVNIVDSANTVVDSYTTTAAGGSWSVAVTALQAQALADGNYTVTADVSDAAGNAAPQASRSIVVHEGAVRVAAGTTFDLTNTAMIDIALINAGTVSVVGGGVSTLDGVNVTNTGGTGGTGSVMLDGNGFATRPFVSTTSMSVELTTANANDVIILDILQNGSTVGMVSDTAGLSWHQRAVAGTAPQTIYEYYAIAPTALSADAITVNFAGTASYVDLNAFGISGANISAPFDASTSLPATPAATLGAVTASNANDFIFAAYRALDPNPDAGDGWTGINASGGYYLSEYQIVSATQAGLVAKGPTTGENGGVVDAVAVAPASAATTALTVATGSTLDLNNTTITAGILANSGTLEVIGSAASTLIGFSIANADATMKVLTGASLVLQNTSVDGGSLINAGTVNSTGTSLFNNIALTNSGLLETTTAGELTISGGSLTNSGFVETNGSLNLESISVANANGAMTIDAGSGLDLNNSTIKDGALANAGTVSIVGGGVSTLDNVYVVNTGARPVTGLLAIDGDGFTSRPFVVTTSASVSLTTSNANDIIVLDILQNGTTVGSVSDTAGLTWHQRAVAGVGSQTIYEYYAIATNALSADNVTVHFTSTASYVDLNAFGISGANTAAPFDSSASLPATPANSLGSATTSNANDLIFAAYRSLDPTPNAGAGWSAIASGQGYYLSEYQIVSSPQAGLVTTGPTAGENGGIVDSVVQADPSTSAAAVTIDTGSTLNFNNASVTGGSLINSGTFNSTGASTLTGVSVTNSGALEATSGALTISGSVNNSGSLAANGASVDITDAVTGNGTASISGADAVLEFGAASSAATTFETGAAGLLKLDTAESFNGTVAGFAAGDAIDMTDFLFANNPTLTVAGSGLAGTYTDVTVHDGALSETVALLNQLAGQYAVDPSAYTLVS